MQKKADEMARREPQGRRGPEANGVGDVADVGEVAPPGESPSVPLAGGLNLRTPEFAVYRGKPREALANEFPHAPEPAGDLFRRALWI